VTLSARSERPPELANVFDSSAVIAFLFNEPGADRVKALLAGGFINSVNAGEVLAVLWRRALTFTQAKTALLGTRLELRGFTPEEAFLSAEILSPVLVRNGISFGDRACMATGLRLGLPVVTADRPWAALNVPGLRVITIR